MIPAFAEPNIHGCLGPRGASQKIELVFSASPKTVSEEPQESLIPALTRTGRDLAAARTILRFSFRCVFMRNGGKLSHRFKVSLLAIYSHETCNQLASYSECCAIGIPLLPCVLVCQSQIGIRLGANSAASTSTR